MKRTPLPSLGLSSLSTCLLGGLLLANLPAAAGDIQETPLYGTPYRYSATQEQGRTLLQVYARDGHRVAAYPLQRCDACVPEDEECAATGVFGIRLNQAPARPLLAASCEQGAHARLLQIFSPLDDAREPVASFVGAFTLALRVDPYGLSIVTDEVEAPDRVRKIERRWPPEAPLFASDPVPRVAFPPGPQTEVVGLLVGPLRHAVLGHDVRGLYRHLAPLLRTHQGLIGRDALLRRWDLLQEPRRHASELWGLIYGLLDEPAAVDEASGRAVWPWYSALAFRQPELALGWHFAARPTAIRAGPSVASPLLARVEHVALRRIEDLPDVVAELDGWYFVESPDGERGYVQADEAPELAGLMMVAERRQGRWMVTELYLDD